MSLLPPSRLLVFRLLLVLKGEIRLLWPGGSVNFSVHIGLNIRLFPYGWANLRRFAKQESFRAGSKVKSSTSIEEIAVLADKVRFYLRVIDS